MLARLIPPEEWGVFATILIANQVLSAAVSVRLDLVQTPKDPTPYLNTAWTAELARGLVLFLITQALAPAWCDLFRVPEATPLLRVLAFVHLIFALHNIGTDLLRRNLSFGRIYVLQGSEAVAYTIVTLVAGLTLHSAWALVLGTLGSYAARVIASYWVTPIRAGIGFDRVRFLEMFRFSRWTNAHVFLSFVVETVDNAVVARFVSSTALAFYRMGYQVATEGSVALQYVVTEVAYPAVARLQFDRDHVRQSFRGILGLTCASLFPATALLALLGPMLVPLALGERWAPAGAPLQILAFAALARGVLETARPVLLGVGRSREDFVLKLVQATCLVAIVIPAGIVGGVEGVARGVLVAAALSLPVWGYLLRTYVALTWRDIFEPSIAPAIATLCGTAILIYLEPAGPSWVSLVARAAVLLVTYLGVSALLLRLLPRSGFAAARRAIAG